MSINFLKSFSLLVDKVFMDKEAVAESIKTILDALGKGDTATLEDALSKIGIQRDHELYDKVGHLARSLHNSLQEFKSSLEKNNISMTTTNLPDAADKLEAVIKMTEAAAEKTMNLVDKQTFKLMEEKKRAAECLSIIENPATTLTELRVVCLEHFRTQMNRIKELEHLNSEIIVAQTFQDLTGQALQKVVKLVTGIEQQLISLIKLFKTHDHDTEASQTPPMQGSEVKPEERLSQDETDDILKSFGF